MVDLATLANIAEIVGAITVVGGIAFAVLQIGEFRAQRKETAAFELMRTFQNPEHTRAFEVLNDLPENLSSAELTALGEDVRAAVLSVGFQCETIGLMVYRRVLPLDLVDELWGAFIRVSWRKVRRHAEERRVVLGHNNYFEWFQWLAEHLAQNPAPSKRDGAHVTHRGWTP